MKFVLTSKMKLIALGFTGVFAAVGVVILIKSLAANNTIAVEAESGSLANGAKVISDSGAAGGRAIQFGVPAPPPPPPPPPPTNSDKFGLNAVWCMFDGCSYSTALSRLSAAQTNGMRWIRQDFPWPSIQNCGDPTVNTACANPSNWNWDANWVDLFTAVNSINSGKSATDQLHVLGILSYLPSWAKNHTQDQVAQLYGAYAKGMAQHFGGQLSNFELLNEPNNLYNWPSGWISINSLPAETASMMHQAYLNIKSVNGGYTVISGGLANLGKPNGSATPLNGTQWNGVDFLNGVYGAMANTLHVNSSQVFDGVGWHIGCNQADVTTTTDPYCGWYQMSQGGSSVRGLMGANNDGGKKIWVTEWTINTWGTAAQRSSGIVASEAQQATLLPKGFAQFKTLSWGAVLFWYNYHDTAAYSSNADYSNYGGLLRSDFSAKPSWAAYGSAAK